GLDAVDEGSALIGGHPYRALRAPLREVGALLDAAAVHPGRRARDHLLWMAHYNGLPQRRVDEVLDLVGLAAVARRRAGGFSLGMYQRLGIATALLGDPPVLLFDEPVNGLDPEGIFWIRTLMRDLAAEGVVVIGRGTLIADMPIAEFTQRDSHSHVHVVSPRADELARVLAGVGGDVTRGADGSLDVTGLDAAKIGDL